MPQQKPQHLLTAEANSEHCNIWVEESYSAIETCRLFIWALAKDWKALIGLKGHKQPLSVKVAGSDCYPVVILKSCEPELSYILQPSQLMIAVGSGCHKYLCTFN